jgi:hypothetical protein
MTLLPLSVRPTNGPAAQKAIRTGNRAATMFRFIHAADIHLDSPLRGLESYEGVPSFQRLSNCDRGFVKNCSKLYSAAWRKMGVGFAEMTWVVLPKNGG